MKPDELDTTLTLFYAGQIFKFAAYVLLLVCVFCAQLWACKCCQELRKMNRIMREWSIWAADVVDRKRKAKEGGK